MRQEIRDNIYYIYNDEGEILLSIELTDEPNNQIILKTDNEVYAGPINFISFRP